MPSVGLVLGGGGLVGQAFHAGALAAIEHDLGWDARRADVIVGTSAGALSGALLRADVGPEDLAGCFVGASWSPAAALGIEVPSLTPIRWQEACRPQMPSIRLLTRCTRLPWWRSPVPSLLTMMRDGDEPLAPHLSFLGALLGTGWSSEPLLVTATRQRDGRRVVFDGAVSASPSLATAVEASCAVPSYFRPVTIDGEQHLDGGLHSATNADLLVPFGLDLTIVVSPLSTDARLSWTMDGLVRRVASRRLRQEVELLEAAGHQVVVIEPGAEAVDAMGHDLMSVLACRDTVREAFLDLGRASTLMTSTLRDALRQPLPAVA
jgi:NTE family protein